MVKDEGLERSLSRLLTAGTRATMVALALGLAATFLWPRAPATHVLLMTGLGVLLLTPVARVGIAVISYARRREWAFLFCTAVVLVLLIGGFVSALR